MTIPWASGYWGVGIVSRIGSGAALYSKRGTFILDSIGNGFLIRRPGPARRGLVCLSLCLFGLLSTPLAGQELVPAAYTPTPVGVNLLSLSGGYSSGEVSFDPSLPVEDASARIHAWSVSYGRTFGFLGRAANVTLIAPYLVGVIEGVYVGEQTFVERSGIFRTLRRQSDGRAGHDLRGIR